MAARVNFQNFTVTISQRNLEELSSYSISMHDGRLLHCSAVMIAEQMRILQQFRTFSWDVLGLIVAVVLTELLTEGWFLLSEYWSNHYDSLHAARRMQAVTEV